MSKQITNVELAGIVSKLLISPDEQGELTEARTYQSFMTEIARVVSDHCGGDILNPASPLDGVWYVGVHWNDSVPATDGVWHNYDREADFAPADSSDPHS